MSEIQSLHAAPRTITRKEVAQLRRAGRTPAVLYGPGVDEPISLDVETKVLMRLLTHGRIYETLALHIEGEVVPRQVRIQDLQQHVTRLTPLHADFLQIAE
jgi:ribosomal protein L25 (general stress protein Ctc)